MFSSLVAGAVTKLSKIVNVKFSNNYFLKRSKIMNSLVAYDSEISDSDDEQESYHKLSNQPVNTEKVPVKPLVVDSQDLFKALPQPKKATSHNLKFSEETEDEFLLKKETPLEFPKKTTERKTAKIFLPSLSSFEDEKPTGPSTKFQPCVKGTGLLSLLPQPRSMQVAEQIKKKGKGLLIPDSVKKKVSTPINPKPPVNKTPRQLSSLKYDSSDESDNEEVSMDFFSLSKKADPLEDLSADLDIGTSSNVAQKYEDNTIQASAKIESNQEANSEHLKEYEENQSYYNAMPAQGSNQNANMDIDDDTLRKLCGSRARRKGENMQIIDINQKEMLPDPREWLTKALTEDNSKRSSSSKRRGDEPTTQQRRKHQITYLAHQAKAHEHELQNQWANNRLSKKQTQSKYGF